MQLPKETKEGQTVPGAGVTGDCTSLNMVLGTKLRSFARADIAFNIPDLSPQLITMSMEDTEDSTNEFLYVRKFIRKT